MNSSGESAPAGAGTAPSADPWSAANWTAEPVLTVPTGPAQSPQPVPSARRRGKALPGMVALGLALVGLVVEIVAITIAAPASATETSWAVASVLAWIANGLTLAGVVTGLVAVVARLGRWWGAPAIVLGLLANPWLQVTVLGALS
ncbi:hypothetical protein FVA74_12805 [Salinibacterium sp. dk2585]|uniref:hypothetical protein n=1 Tax=unclassified Salinibacterium TaxID=2632331 RepID=UPI0011C2558C|nr:MULTISPECIES: hypothetical protein [unclassified Salinibacterium]QEE62354.1 hypothetical protein FVA74_12805 [Salinibacterium sp. dk2585]TXK52763.1 hypothetical protein FVP63_12590 [Salinibacterium sp. dk5596]